MAIKALPSQEVLRQLLEYNPETGGMIWRERVGQKRWNTLYAGRPAFATFSNGYLTGRLFGANVRAHRVLWVLHYGEDPAGPIDHINGDKDDNRICNLRVTDAAGNAQNRPLRRDNRTGFNGVARRGGKYLANIRFLGKLTHLGTFECIADAIAARQKAERDMGFHENHGRVA